LARIERGKTVKGWNDSMDSFDSLFKKKIRCCMKVDAKSSYEIHPIMLSLWMMDALSIEAMSKNLSMNEDIPSLSSFAFDGIGLDEVSCAPFFSYHGISFDKD